MGTNRYNELQIRYLSVILVSESCRCLPRSICVTHLHEQDKGLGKFLRVVFFMLIIEPTSSDENFDFMGGIKEFIYENKSY